MYEKKVLNRKRPLDRGGFTWTMMRAVGEDTIGLQLAFTPFDDRSAICHGLLVGRAKLQDMKRICASLQVPAQDSGLRVEYGSFD